MSLTTVCLVALCVFGTAVVLFFTAVTVFEILKLHHRDKNNRFFKLINDLVRQQEIHYQKFEILVDRCSAYLGCEPEDLFLVIVERVPASSGDVLLEPPLTGWVERE